MSECLLERVGARHGVRNRGTGVVEVNRAPDVGAERALPGRADRHRVGLATEPLHVFDAVAIVVSLTPTPSDTL